MATCSFCHRPLKSPEAIAAGMGPVCLSKHLLASGGSASSITIHFLYRRRDGRRGWLAIDNGKWIVHFDGNTPGMRHASCECASGLCDHIKAAAEHDTQYLISATGGRDSGRRRKRVSRKEFQEPASR